MNMLPEERADLILNRLQRDGRLMVDALADEFGVSGETIRRDLKRLEKDGLLRRSHGGAVPVQARNAEDLPFPARSVLNITAKRRIAAAAAVHVGEGQALMLDSSSTVREFMRELGSQRNLTIVTNSIALLTDVNTHKQKVISVGGELQPDMMTFLGPLAVASAKQYHADYAIISVKALSKRAGLMVANAAEAEIKRTFIECADRTLLLVDGDKFDGTGLVSVAPLSAVNSLITDRPPTAEWADMISNAGVKLEIAK